MTLHLDDSVWPHVRASLSGPASEADVSRYVDAMNAWLDRREPHTLLIHVKSGASTTSGQRRVITDWIRKRRLELAEFRAAVAVVTGSRTTRAAANAAYWLAPPPYEVAVFADLEPAQRWVRRQLAPAR